MADNKNVSFSMGERTTEEITFKITDPDGKGHTDCTVKYHNVPPMMIAVMKEAAKKVFAAVGQDFDGEAFNYNGPKPQQKITEYAVVAGLLVFTDLGLMWAEQKGINCDGARKVREKLFGKLPFPDDPNK